MVLAKYWGGGEVAGIISASGGSSVRRAVRSPLSGSTRLSAAITTTAQVTSLDIRRLGGRGIFTCSFSRDRSTQRMIFCLGEQELIQRILGRAYRWVISAILGLAKSHGSILPPWRLPSPHSMMEYQGLREKVHLCSSVDTVVDTNKNMLQDSKKILVKLLFSCEKI